MFQTIVVGTDGSATAGEAVRQAGRLANTTGATVHLVTAYKPIEALYTSPEMMPANIHDLIDPAKDAARTLDEAAGKIKAEGLKCETHAIPGDAASALIEVAETANADLIVVGNRGMSGAARFLLGSVPNKVAHHAPCAVLIVRTT